MSRYSEVGTYRPSTNRSLALTEPVPADSPVPSQLPAGPRDFRQSREIALHSLPTRSSISSHSRPPSTPPFGTARLRSPSSPRRHHRPLQRPRNPPSYPDLISPLSSPLLWDRWRDVVDLPSIASGRGPFEIQSLKGPWISDVLFLI